MRSILTFPATLIPLFALLLWPPAATQAQDLPTSHGTHFILEGGVGASPSASPRPAFDVSAGVGGRLRGTPLRAYLITQLGYLQSVRDESRAWPEEHRQDVSIGTGLRLYVGLPDQLRLHVDVLGGPGWVHSELVRTGGSVLIEESWFPQLTLSPGLSYRIYRELSIGVRVKWLLSRTSLDAAREAALVERRHPFSVLAGVTWHF